MISTELCIKEGRKGEGREGGGEEARKSRAKAGKRDECYFEETCKGLSDREHCSVDMNEGVIEPRGWKRLGQRVQWGCVVNPS